MAPRSSRAALPAIVTQVCALRERDARRRSGQFAVEGVRFFVKAVEAGLIVDDLVISRVLLKSAAARSCARKARRAGTRFHAVTPEQFRTLSVTAHASGVAAVLRQPWTALARASPTQGTCWIAVESSRSPGNLGTILRSAAAVGAAGLIVLGPGVDPFDPGVVRASMGALFGLQLIRTTTEQFRAWATRSGVRVLGACPRGSQPYDEVSLEGPVVWMLGDEGAGLSTAQRAVCDDTVRIPVASGVDSLNLGTAASLLLYETLRRGRREPRGRRAVSR